MNQISIFNFYPDVAGFKKGETSKEAARTIEPTAKILREKVLEVLKRGAKTADEVAEVLGVQIWSCRPRLSELLARKQIKDSGVRRKNQSGKSAVVWELLI